ncbi:MAG: hypothetical protein IPK64_00495 [bacterium]|nr:hypothetical protein [bacterium]
MSLVRSLVRRHWSTVAIRLVLAPIALACLGLAVPAAATVLTWSADDPFAAGNTIVIDFGAAVSGVTALDAVVTGIGGVQHWTIYQGVENPTGTVPFEMTLACDPDPVAGSSAAVAVWLPILEPFSEGLTFTPAVDWTWLHDGVFTLEVSYVHGEFPLSPFCYGTGFTRPQVGHLDLVLTCEAAVHAEPRNWGATKSLFR